MKTSKERGIKIGRCKKIVGMSIALSILGINASAQDSMLQDARTNDTLAKLQELQQDSIFKELDISEVVVKAHIPVYKAIKGGISTRIAGSTLAKLGTAKNVIEHLTNIQKKIDGSLDVIGKGTPIIYINHRKVRNMSELEYLKAENIQSIEVITMPGAEYDASVGAIIRIKTLKNQEDGIGIDVMSSADYAYRWNTSQQVGIDWQKGKLETFATMRYDFSHQHQTAATDIFTHTHDSPSAKTSTATNQLWQQAATSVDNGVLYNVYGKMGFNYQLGKHHSLGAMYELTSQPRTRMHNQNYTDVLLNASAYDVLNTEDETFEKTEPTHHVNTYYTGQFGKWSMDVNADFLLGKKRGNESVAENSENFEDYRVDTSQDSKNLLYAGKLVMGFPIYQGLFSFGAEYTYTHRKSHSTGYNEIIQATNDKIKDKNLGVFMGYEGNFGIINANIGFRYEHVIYNFYDNNVKSEEKSKTYDNLFPTLSLNTTIDKAHISLDYHIRTFRPLYEMLESNTHYGNRYTYLSGSPALQPTYINAVELSGQYKDLHLSVGFNHYKDDILFSIETYEQNPSISISSFRNLSSRNELTYSLAYAPTFSFWKPELTINTNTQWLHLSHLDKEKKMDGTIVHLSCNNTFALPANLLFRIDGNWSSAGYTQNMRLRSTGFVNASLYKELAHGKWTMLLEYNDILHTMRNATWMYDKNIQEYRATKDNTQQIKLTICYRLNNRQSKYKGTGAGNEERNRT